MKKKQIALVEAHDARLDSMTVRPGGSVVLLLAHLGVYVPRDSDHYDVWNHRAKLQFEDLTDLQVTGSIPDDGWIVDDEVNGPRDPQPQLREFLDQPVPIREFSCTFRNGARLALCARTMVIVFEDGGIVVDSWEGPL
ncbi:MAG TPA: hypothetical protein VI356_19295 [Myxococcales bacterium]